jgi:hypothetical protein
VVSDGPSPAPLKGSQLTKTTIDRIIKEHAARTPDAFGRCDSTRQGARRPGRHELRVVFTSGKGNSTSKSSRVNTPLRFFLFCVVQGRPGGVETLRRDGRYID